MKITLDLTKDEGKEVIYTTTIDWGHDNVSTSKYYIDSVGLLNNISPDRSIFETSGLIPPGLRYYDPMGGVIVFEKPPAIKTVQYTWDKGMGNPKKVDIPVPWTVYVAVANSMGAITHLQMFFRNSQLKGFNSRLGAAWLPNVYQNSGQVCRSDDSLSESAGSNLGSVIDLIYRSIWEAQFNRDLVPDTGSSNHQLKTSKHHEKHFRVLKNYDKSNRLKVLFPTYGMALHDVLNQFYPTPVHCGSKSPKATPKTLRDEDGDPSFAPWHSLQDVLYTHYHRNGRSSGITAIRTSFNQSITSHVKEGVS